MKRHIWQGIKMVLVLVFIGFVFWVIRLDCPNQAYGQFQSPAMGLSAQSIKGDHVDSTLEDFVFNDAFRITSVTDDSMFMTKKYIDDAAGGLVAQSVKGDHVDSTSEDFVFNDAFRITSAQAESIFITKNHVEKIVEDSLNEYLLLAGGTMTGDITMGDNLWIGLGSGAGRIEFDDQTIDEVNILGANVGIGTATPDEKLHVTDNNAALKLEDDSGNDATINVGNSQLCLAIDPDNLITSSDICFDIDGDEVARFHQSTNFGIGTLSPPERLSVVGNTATGDTATGDNDVYYYVSTDGSWTTEYLKWDDGNARFELSDDLYVGGTILSANILTKSFTIQAIDSDHDIKIWKTPVAITIDSVFGQCDGGTNVIGGLDEYNWNNTALVAVVNADWTFTTTYQAIGSFTNAGIAAKNHLKWHTTSVSGTVDFFDLTIWYHED